MHELRVHRQFSAAHAIRMAGQMETLHGHDWRVVVQVVGDALDADGLLCDFHALEASVDRVLAPFHGRTLNDVAPFNRTNPTAELVAQHVASEVARVLPAGVRLGSVSIGEAPGCEAIYRPDMKGHA